MNILFELVYEPASDVENHIRLQIIYNAALLSLHKNPLVLMPFLFHKTQNRMKLPNIVPTGRGHNSVVVNLYYTGKILGSAPNALGQTGHLEELWWFFLGTPPCSRSK